jgi:negative regulator of flagellin synthesis FlgM
MEIFGKKPFPGANPYIRNIANPRRNAEETASRPDESGGDRVALSPQARRFQEARRIAADRPEIRTDRVAQVRERLATGTFRVEGERIALRMLAESLLADMPGDGHERGPRPTPTNREES